MRRKWRFRLVRTFFGLSDEYMAEVVYETIFQLNYHMSLSISEVHSLPVTIRSWLLQRLAEEKEKEADNLKTK